MRITATTCSLSWIPSEGVPGLAAVPFDRGFTHYDRPIPDRVDHRGGPAGLLRHDGARFANTLTAWIDVDDATGAICGHGQHGEGDLADTTVRLGSFHHTFHNRPRPVVRAEPVVGDGWVRFTQSAGGHTRLPAPRRRSRFPFVALTAPPVWTTLSLTLHADGRATHELVGASPFPRHWVYGPDGRLSHKSGVLDFPHWYRGVGWRSSPWGRGDLPVLATTAESAAERRLADLTMRSGPADRRRLDRGEVLARQGEADERVWLVLDGILAVEVDGHVIAQIGPGSVVGERSRLDGGRRTATVRAVTPARVALAHDEHLADDHLHEVAVGHRREVLARG